MTYRSVEEIFAAKVDVLERLRHRVRGLAGAQADVRPSEDGWSIEEIVEHLSMVEGEVLQLITTLLVKTEKTSAQPPGPSPFEVSLAQYARRTQAEKYKTRDRYVPSGKATVAESLEKLHDMQAELLKLGPRLRSVDLGVVRFPHPAFGPLSLGQWIAFIGAHEERHLAQIERILALPESLRHGDDQPRGA